MLTGPILFRELLTASRRPQTYLRRSTLAAMLVIGIGAFCAVTRIRNPGRATVQEIAAFVRFAFGILLFWQIKLTVPLVVLGIAYTLDFVISIGMPRHGGPLNIFRWK
jgi:hypothetical protein